MDGVLTARARVLHAIERIERRYGIPVPRMKRARDLAYAGQLHAALWHAHVERSASDEARFGPVCRDVMNELSAEVLKRWKEVRKDKVDEVPSPFDRAKWLRIFRQRLGPILRGIVVDRGNSALDEVGLGVSFNVEDTGAIAFMRQREQRFAVEVTQTTWEQVREQIAQGMKGGETTDQIAARIRDTMELRARQSETTIARTEVNGASNGGALLGYKQSGIVKQKTWLSSLDEKTRDSHTEAHGQTVPLSGDFQVGDGAGPSPGQIGIAGEDINCRCTMTAVID